MWRCGLTAIAVHDPGIKVAGPRSVVFPAVSRPPFEFENCPPGHREFGLGSSIAMNVTTKQM